jgi:hypothetical protein
LTSPNDEDDQAGTADTIADASGQDGTAGSATSTSGATTSGEGTGSPTATGTDGGDTAGGTDASDSSGGTSGVDECQVDEDCKLVNDCCNCMAAPVGENPPDCPHVCDAPSCEAVGLGEIEVECRFGTCQFVPRNCNPYTVACDEPAPECPEGMAPQVDPDGFCWEGCIPAEACDFVDDCSLCADDEACVAHSSGLTPSPQPLVACEPIPSTCDGQASCECMPGVCEDQSLSCLDGGGGPSCECTAC